jgi:CheY-like chemotaxis protein
MDKPSALIVEDDALLCTVIEADLEDSGFGVTIARSGAQALAQLQNGADGFACLVTDIRLGPGIDGWEVARQARLLKPTIPVIYMTGDSAANWAAQGVPNSILLGKPFALSQLRTAIAQLINNGPVD